ncbi:unnamed protein product [Prorocentrum cordatum]|uniref:Uncharacterized protein n=1 Tax=Prorocentrum cordatum TaxID=2364126 RepID=A0ABN9RI12_9DINO|nr:unnamed protein product [Polarella glacialis]
MAVAPIASAPTLLGRQLLQLLNNLCTKCSIWDQRPNRQGLHAEGVYASTPKPLQQGCLVVSVTTGIMTASSMMRCEIRQINCDGTSSSNSGASPAGSVAAASMAPLELIIFARATAGCTTQNLG